MTVARKATITPSRRLVDVQVAAEALGVHERTIRRWLNRGELQGFRLGNKLLRVDLAEVEAFARPIDAEEISPSKATADRELLFPDPPPEPPLV